MPSWCLGLRNLWRSRIGINPRIFLLWTPESSHWGAKRLECADKRRKRAGLRYMFVNQEPAMLGAGRGFNLEDQMTTENETELRPLIIFGVLALCLANELWSLASLLS